MIGQKIGQYQIISVIGQGGMATVYKAYQPAFDRHVAIKVLGAQLSQDPTFVKRFQREAKVVARIEHRSIVPIYGYGEHDGLYYIVMRLIEGGTLRKKLHYDPISLPLAARIIEQVGEALDFAHQRDVIHRDLKPSNILLDERNNAYLTDFGIAKMLGSNTQVTATGVVGTPSYMSPEQCQGKTLGPSSDLYALGAILFEILTGKVPYEADTPLSVMYMHVREPIPSACALNPKLPPTIDRVILRALAKHPNERYPSAAALAAAFREIAGSEEPPKQKGRGLFSFGQRQKPSQKPKALPKEAPVLPPSPPSASPPPASLPPSPRSPAISAPPTVPGGLDPVSVDPDSNPPTLKIAPIRKGLPKAVQSIMVGFGGMALLVGLVGAGLFGLSLLKSETNGPIVATMAPFVTPTSLIRTLTSEASPVIVPSATASLSPTNTTQLTSLPTLTPSLTLTLTPSMTLTASLTPTATLTLAPSTTASPASTVAPGVLPPPGSGDRLVFSSNRYGDYDIFLIDSDSSNLHQVTNSSAADYSPVWAPDGKEIALVSARDGDAEIWIVNAGCVMQSVDVCEGNLVQRTFNTATDIDPAWSPNGQQIAYASNQDGDFEIYVMNADGSNGHPITNNASDEFAPQWSPDGTQIVYHSQTGSSSHLYNIPAAGGAANQLTSNATSNINFWPDWSPDGAKIAYTATSSTVAGARVLFVIDLGSGASTSLLDGKDHDEAPAWSPDGQRIAFASDRGGGGVFDLYLFTLSSGNLQPLTSGAGNNVTPDWQPHP